MISDKQLNEFIRDNKTWKRAAAQTCSRAVRTSTVHDGPRALLRRGNSENAQTATFAVSLRSACHTSQDGSALFAASMERPWTNSTRTDPSSPDMLRSLLRANLERRASSSSRSKPDKQPNHRQRSPAAGVDTWRGMGPSILSTEVARRQLAAAEAGERRKLRAMELRAREQHTDRFFHDLHDMLRMEEYNGRREVFRDSIVERASIDADRDQQLYDLCGVSCDVYKAMLQLQRKEASSRELLRRSELNESKYLEKFSSLIQLYMIEQ